MDRLNENLEIMMANAGSEDFSGLLFYLENIKSLKYTNSDGTILTLVCLCAVKKSAKLKKQF